MRIFYFSYYIFLSHAAEEPLLCTASLKHQSAELFASPPTKKTKKKHRFRFADYRTGSPLTPNIFIRLRFTFTSVTSKRCSTYLQITRSATSMLTSKCVCVCVTKRERERVGETVCVLIQES